MKIITVWPVLIILIIISCTKHREWKYRVDGTVKVRKNFPSYLYSQDSIDRPAVWYTDTFRFQNETLFIDNSNGTSFAIAKPYRISRVEK